MHNNATTVAAIILVAVQINCAEKKDHQKNWQETELSGRDKIILLKISNKYDKSSKDIAGQTDVFFPSEWWTKMHAVSALHSINDNDSLIDGDAASNFLAKNKDSILYYRQGYSLGFMLPYCTDDICFTYGEANFGPMHSYGALFIIRKVESKMETITKIPLWQT